MTAHYNSMREQYRAERLCICGVVDCDYFGLCHCGCDEFTTISKGNTFKDNGSIRAIAGVPQLYKAGHQPNICTQVRSHKGKPQGKTVQVAKDLLAKGGFSGLCYCGCGGKTKIATVTAQHKDGHYKQIVGLPKRYILGASKEG